MIYDIIYLTPYFLCLFLSGRPVYWWEWVIEVTTITVRGSLCDFNYSSVSFMELVSHHLVNKSSELEQSSMDNFPLMGLCCPSIFLLISLDLKPVLSDTKMTMPACLVLGSLCLGYPFPHLSPKEVSVLDWEAFFFCFLIQSFSLGLYWHNWNSDIKNGF